VLPLSFVLSKKEADEKEIISVIESGADRCAGTSNSHPLCKVVLGYNKKFRINVIRTLIFGREGNGKSFWVSRNSVLLLSAF